MHVRWKATREQHFKPRPEYEPFCCLVSGLAGSIQSAMRRHEEKRKKALECPDQFGSSFTKFTCVDWV